MNGCVFRKPEPIGVEITLNKEVVTDKALNILNKIAEARYDGQNAQYVNNLQPEVDFDQDSEIIGEFFADGVARVVKRIEPYVIGVDDISSTNYVTTLHLQFPENWKRQFESVLRKRIEDYIVYMIIAHWVEKVSMADTQYSMDKAEDLLYEVRHTCDMRQGAVHRKWNTTY